jgi:hypothetical protein
MKFTKLGNYNQKKEKQRYNSSILKIIRGEDLGKGHGIPNKKDQKKGKMRFQTAESLVGKCDKVYDEVLIEYETYRKLHKLNPGEYPMTHHKLTMSPRVLEQRADKASYKFLYKSVLDIDLTEKEIDELIKNQEYKY